MTREEARAVWLDGFAAALSMSQFVGVDVAQGPLGAGTGHAIHVPPPYGFQCSSDGSWADEFSLAGMCFRRWWDEKALAAEQAGGPKT